MDKKKPSPAVGLFQKIREVVSMIPERKVVSYGDVAKAVGIRDARKVGWALWGNQDKRIPCHRVVGRDGTLAEKFSLGGWREQKDRLEQDGVRFREEKKVDMNQYRWIEISSPRR